MTDKQEKPDNECQCPNHLRFDKHACPCTLERLNYNDMVDRIADLEKMNEVQKKRIEETWELNQRYEKALEFIGTQFQLMPVDCPHNPRHGTDDSCVLFVAKEALKIEERKNER